MGAMVIARKEITLSTVAAMLTIVGYSITDTVVVYDRIRENLGKHRNMSFSAVINLSISEMLGRTIITSGRDVALAGRVPRLGHRRPQGLRLRAARRHRRRHLLVDLRRRAASPSGSTGASSAPPPTQKKAITRTRAAKRADTVV